MRNLIFDLAAVLNDPELGAAIDIIARNCGESARRFLNSTACRLTKAQMLAISRMTSQQQRLELQRAGKGRRPFQKAYFMTPLLDAQPYSEILSQIGRAWSIVNQVGMDVAWLQMCSLELLRLVDLPVASPEELMVNCQTLGEMLSPLLGEGQSRAVRPMARCIRLPDFRRFKGRIAAANRLIAKSIQDIPQIPSEVRPTPEQQTYILSHLEDIYSKSGTLRRVRFRASLRKCRIGLLRRTASPGVTTIVEPNASPNGGNRRARRDIAVRAGQCPG